MQELIIGATMLGCVVAFRYVRQYHHRQRFHRWWKTANERLSENDVAGAEAALRRCVRLEPLWAPVRGLLAATLVNQGKMDEAEAEFTMVVRLHPKAPEGHIELGLFYAMCHDDRLDEAIASFQSAIECEPKVRELLAREPRLAALREVPEFQALLAS